MSCDPPKHYGFNCSGEVVPNFTLAPITVTELPLVLYTDKTARKKALNAVRGMQESAVLEGRPGTNRAKYLLQRKRLRARLLRAGIPHCRFMDTLVAKYVMVIGCDHPIDADHYRMMRRVGLDGYAATQAAAEAWKLENRIDYEPPAEDDVPF